MSFLVRLEYVRDAKRIPQLLIGDFERNVLQKKEYIAKSILKKLIIRKEGNYIIGKKKMASVSDAAKKLHTEYIVTNAV